MCFLLTGAITQDSGAMCKIGLRMLTIESLYSVKYCTVEVGDNENYFI